MRISLALLPAAVLAACGACASPHSPSQAPHANSVAALESQTVALVAERDDGTHGAVCAGVWVSPDAVLTADHCMDDRELGAPVEFVVRDDVQADAVVVIRVGAVVARDPLDDLALIAAKTLAPRHGIAMVGAPVVGAPVQTMGHPLGLWWSYSEGAVAAVRLASFADDAPARWYVQSTAPVAPGNSGGGLFDSEGRLVGICHVKAHNSDNISFYVHPDDIAAFLAKAGIQ